ncbi:MAG: hypothetical protein MHMPM18_003788 [Marteilia pararefringens]
MVHPGVVYMCLYFSKPSRAYCFGDTLQLKFQGHVAASAIVHTQLKSTRVIYTNMTFRCPLSIAKILRQFYPNLRTQSKVQGGIRIKKVIPGDYSMLPRQSTLVVYTTHEKQLLISAGFDTKTVAECQGITLRHIDVVRLMVQEMAIYGTESILIVALTRHTHSLDYYTVDTNDVLSKLLKERTPEIPFSATRKSYSVTHRGIVNVECGHETVYDEMIPKSISESEFYTAILMRAQYDHIGHEWVERPTTWSDAQFYSDQPESVNLDAFQSAIDTMYDRLDEELLAHRLDPVNLNIPPQLKVDPEAIFFAKEKQSIFLKPKIRTPQVPRNTAKPGYFISALLKRNLDPPNLHGLRERNLVIDIADTFMATYIDATKLKHVNGSASYYNEVWFQYWFNDRTPEQRLLFEGLAHHHTRGDRYEAHVKPDLKVPLDNSHNATVIGGQVIAAHHCIEMGVYSPIFQAFMAKLMASLKPNFVINAKLSVNDLSSFVTTTLRHAKLFKVLESDFSKFDKSQDSLALDLFIEILRRFKVPETILNEWRKGHIITTLFDRQFGLRQPIAFQRKSGDASTFCGNTLLTMAALASAYPVHKAMGGAFGGDDSVIFFPTNVDVEDRSQYIMNVFNLFTKIEVFENSIYFASKFFINVHGAWWAVPDPIKNAVRIGRHDMFCREHVVECERSLRDNLQYLCDEGVRQALAIAVSDRYAKKLMSTSEVLTVINFLACIVYGYLDLSQLYEGSEDLWARPLPYRYM